MGIESMNASNQKKYWLVFWKKSQLSNIQEKTAFKPFEFLKQFMIDNSLYKNNPIWENWISK